MSTGGGCVCVRVSRDRGGMKDPDLNQSTELDEPHVIPPWLNTIRPCNPLLGLTFILIGRIAFVVQGCRT